jgi:hypothetical protein
MQIAAVLARAHAALGHNTVYKLGKGGMNPGSPLPSANGECDCSGFVAWCLGMSRKTHEHFYVQFNGGWIETTAVWTDVGQNVGIFEPSQRVPAAVLVYPDHAGHQGHIGIVVDGTHVIHCSSSNYTNHGDAIRMTNFQVFDNNASTRLGWLHGLF